LVAQAQRKDAPWKTDPCRVGWLRVVLDRHPRRLGESARTPRLSSCSRSGSRSGSPSGSRWGSRCPPGRMATPTTLKPHRTRVVLRSCHLLQRHLYLDGSSGHASPAGIRQVRLAATRSYAHRPVRKTGGSRSTGASQRVNGQTARIATTASKPCFRPWRVTNCSAWSASA
jgi:hypothetical protein